MNKLAYPAVTPSLAHRFAQRYRETLVAWVADAASRRGPRALILAEGDAQPRDYVGRAPLLQVNTSADEGLRCYALPHAHLLDALRLAGRGDVAEQLAATTTAPLQVVVLFLAGRVRWGLATYTTAVAPDRLAAAYRSAAAPRAITYE